MKAISLISSLMALFIAYVALSAVPNQNDERVLDLLSQSVVKVVTKDKHRGGTGFVIQMPDGGRGTITNFHVCKHLDSPLAIRDGEFEVDVKIIRADLQKDLCLLTPVPGLALKVSQTAPRRFSKVIVLGHPRLRPQTPSVGMFIGNITDSLVMPKEGLEPCPEHTKEVGSIFGEVGCEIEYSLGNTTNLIDLGNSGSPAVNSKGELVGVMNSMSSSGTGAFITLPDLKSFLEAK